MEFHRFVPAPPLERFVDHMWLVRVRGIEHPRQVLFPDGGVTLHFSLESAPGLVDRGSGAVRRFATCFVSGERVEPYTLDMPERATLVGVRFRPGAVYPFLGFPAAELEGEVVDLELVFGGEAAEAREQMLISSNPANTFEIVERLLRRRLERVPEHVPRLVTGGLEALARAGPGASIIGLAAELGVSHRTLLRRFDRWVGVRPKIMQRILRFQRVISWEDAHDRLDWSAAALRCGYYDQAHLIRDFRAYTGTTPTAYRALRLDYPNYVPDLA
jgi:AraC-like DNA-binding protein